MNVIKFSSSLLAATGLLFSAAPAFAGPFDTLSPGVFTSPGVVMPGAVGNATLETTPTPDSTQQAANGNSEVQGLGDHDSWVSQEVLDEDARALCSDVGLGNNTIATSARSSSSSAASSRSRSSSASSGGGGGGVSILGIGVSGSGQRSGRNSNSSAQNNRERESSANTFEASTVVVGRNCDAFVEAAAARDMNYEDNLTERYRIRSGRRGEQVDGLLER